MKRPKVRVLKDSSCTRNVTKRKKGKYSFGLEKELKQGLVVRIKNGAWTRAYDTDRYIALVHKAAFS